MKWERLLQIFETKQLKIFFVLTPAHLNLNHFSNQFQLFVIDNIL